MQGLSQKARKSHAFVEAMIFEVRNKRYRKAVIKDFVRRNLSDGSFIDSAESIQR